MLKLNNIKDNTIIVVAGFDIYGNRIVYEHLDVINKIINTDTFKPNPSLLSKCYDSISLNEFSLDQLLNSNLIDEYFIKSEDPQNWIHTTRTVRLIVPQKTIIESLKDNNDLWPIIERLRDENNIAEEKFIFESSDLAVVYVNNIDPGDAPIVEPYIETEVIKVQTKSVKTL